MGTDELTAHIEGPAALETVEQALDALESLWQRTPRVPAEDRMLFALALSEVATNVAQHGRSATAMSIGLTVSAEALRAVVRDDAPPAQIDLTGVTMPDADAESGRGLAIATTVLDVCEHRAERDGNVWTLLRGYDDAGGGSDMLTAPPA